MPSYDQPLRVAPLRAPAAHRTWKTLRVFHSSTAPTTAISLGERTGKHQYPRTTPNRKCEKVWTLPGDIQSRHLRVRAPCGAQKQEAPRVVDPRGFGLDPAAFYSPTPKQCSTIDAVGLNFRVRNGNGCGPHAMATGNTKSEFRNPKSESRLRCDRREPGRQWSGPQT